MNANEVIANRALELMGHKKGEYKYCDPHDHVNRSQSTNDSYPTSMHIGMALGNAEIVAAFKKLIEAFRAKGEGVQGHPQDGTDAAAGRRADDARPGVQRVRARRSRTRFARSKPSRSVLCEISMGGTAIGTGLNAPKGYAQKCADHLAKITGFPIKLAEDLVEATQDTQAFVLYSSVLKSLAIKLAKVGNDLRLLSSGPRCGLHEINLPATQPGSSIMPGKVNPVIPEVTNMVAYRVIGNDLVVTLSAEAGQLQLNAFEPVIAAVHLRVADAVRQRRATRCASICVDGITANADVCKHYLESSIGTVTALNPVIGYDKATELAAEALKTGEGILELVREKHILTDAADRRDPESRRADRVRDGRPSHRCSITVGGVIMSEHSVCQKRNLIVALWSLVVSGQRAGERRRKAAAADTVAVDTKSLPNVVVLATGGTIAGAAKSDVTGRLHQRPGRRRGAARRGARRRRSWRKLTRRADLEHRLAGHERRGVDQARHARQRAARHARRDRRRDHARHGHDRGDGVLPESRRQVDGSRSC